MDSECGKTQRGSKRIPVSHVAWVAIGCAALGLLTSWCLREVNPWWSGLLSNVSAAIILIIPGDLLLQNFRKQVGRIEKSAVQASANAKQALAVADEAARSLKEISDALVDRQRAEFEEVLEVYKRIEESADRRTLYKALRKAIDSEIISQKGIRVPVALTDVHFRFAIDDSQPETVVVYLEDDYRSVLSTTVWGSEVSQEDFYLELVERVREAGKDLGVGLNDPTCSVKVLSEKLAMVADLRSQNVYDIRDRLRHIEQFLHGWFFMEDKFVPEDSPDYVVREEQLKQLDWGQHLIDKGYSNGSELFEFAKKFYGVERSD